MNMLIQTYITMFISLAPNQRNLILWKRNVHSYDYPREGIPSPDPSQNSPLGSSQDSLVHVMPWHERDNA